MNFIKYITCVIILTATCFAAEVVFEYVNTRSDGKDITIEWRAGTERMVLRYEVERSTDNANFRTVGMIEPRGASQTYRYIDQDVFMKQTGNEPKIARGNFYYRIKVVGTDNTINFSNSTSVVHNVSSVRRTWGMIKEMFK